MADFESALKALAAVVVLCKETKRVRELAERLMLTRQTVYLWASPDCALSNRAAKWRLLEISRLPGEALTPAVELARQAIEAIETAEATEEGRQEA